METVISGVAQTGPVRVNNLACPEALLNVSVNGIEILLIAFGALSFMIALYRKRRAMRSLKASAGASLIFSTRSGPIGLETFLGIALLIIAVNVPGAVNSAWEGLRNANLFQ